MEVGVKMLIDCYKERLAVFDVVANYDGSLCYVSWSELDAKAWDHYEGL